jgi:drug/metabolite transporter (DMT)-like permease
LFQTGPEGYFLSFSQSSVGAKPLSHRLKPSQYAVLALVAICAALGDTCLSRGMKPLPAISLAHPGELIAVVFTPWIAAGIALLIGFFASYLTALSWADLTFVLPATAFGNVIVALLSRFWLHEPISIERWAGILLITIGVGFVAQSPPRTETPTETPALQSSSEVKVG